MLVELALNGMTLEQFHSSEEPVWEDEIVPLLANLDSYDARQDHLFLLLLLLLLSLQQGLDEQECNRCGCRRSEERSQFSMATTLDFFFFPTLRALRYFILFVFLFGLTPSPTCLSLSLARALSPNAGYHY